ncbi:hypothetical protein NGR_c36030 [Sinorhizobium fredii NGR234]|uniref:Uncharacterized protein n=1 Tax=Sinorhizobium fredii (strain NBRC 101917 / NGR234) TaxID=394 RepID=C3MC99_SINFN|nr:hypothetical protein [Sinorhizobium fredii]ACP27324.1 hypothetical protein NGR_c36030 [Sinorhizobium fredii NGR234]
MDPRVKPEDDEWGGAASRCDTDAFAKYPFVAANRSSTMSGQVRPSSVILGLDPRIHAQAPCVGMAGCVYIVTNQKRGTLYIEVTSNFDRRNLE